VFYVYTHVGVRGKLYIPLYTYVYMEVVHRMAKWTTIRIPVELKNKLLELSQKKNAAYWKIIQEAIAWFQSSVVETRDRDVIPEIDKASWYIAKLSYSLAKFKDKPSEENYQWLVKVINQIRERLGVDLQYLVRTAMAYQVEQNRENLIEFWMAWKMAIVDIFFKYVLSKTIKESK